MDQLTLKEKILRVLSERFPDPTHFHQLQEILTSAALPTKEGLRTVEALYLEGKLDGKFLRGEEVEDAALLRITDRGRRNLETFSATKKVSTVKGRGSYEPPALPAEFQETFEAARCAAEIRFLSEKHSASYIPALAKSILIQEIFFAYCLGARLACAAGHWTPSQTRIAIDNAWPALFAAYFDSEHPNVDPAKRTEVREALWQTVRDDQRWTKHLSEMLALIRAQNAGNVDHSKAKKRTVHSNKVASEGKPEPAAEYPARADWLRLRLKERGLTKHDLARFRGPDHKTTQKVLDGLRVREEVLEKIVAGLNNSRGGRKLPLVSLLEIPSN